MGPREALLDRFRGVAAERIDRIEGHVLAGARGTLAPDVLALLRREAHTLKGEARMMGFRRLSEVVHAVEDAIDAARFDGVLPALELGRRLVAGPVAPEAALEAEVQAWLEAVAEEAAPPSPPVPEPTGLPEAPPPEPPERPRAAARSDLRVAADEVAELAAQLARLRRRQHRQGTLVEQLRGELQALRAVAGRRGVGPAERLVRRLHHELIEQGSILDTVAGSLEALRFRALDEVFAGLPRLAHAVARDRGRTVEVVCVGGAVAIDENVLERLREPLVHLVKNAVDHGIEGPEVRERLGKSPVGRVTVTARAGGDEVRIDVEDDGRGVDLEAVGRRAIAQQLVNPEELERMSVDQQLELMFHPRLSTRDAADAWSGRGVGLAAVREAMAELGGHVVAERGAIGCRFRLDLPLTTFATQVMVAKVGPHLVAVPARALRAVRHLSPGDLVDTPRGAAFEHEGRLVALADLGRVLRAGRSLPAAHLPVLVVESGARIGLAVSEVVTTLATVVQPPGRFLQDVGVVAGFAVVGQGTVALVPDMDRVVREGLQQRRWRGGGEGQRRRILVVDDSEFTRDLLTRLLRDMGHEVLEAVNGEQGLERVRADRPELVFTDLDMPVLDGFGLLAGMRARGDTTPVAVISTHRADDVVARAQSLGAAAYLVKAEFDDERLARTIQRLVGP